MEKRLHTNKAIMEAGGWVNAWHMLRCVTDISNNAMLDVILGQPPEADAVQPSCNTSLGPAISQHYFKYRATSYVIYMAV